MRAATENNPELNVLTPVERLIGLSVTDLHPEQVARWVPGIQPETLARLQAMPRLARRLAQLIAYDHGLPPCPPSLLQTPMGRLATLSRGELEECSVLAAAVLQGRAVLRLVERADRLELSSKLGESILRFIVANADVAGSDAPPGPASALVEAIFAAAPGCMAVWLGALPDGVRKRAALKLAPAAAGDGNHADTGQQAAILAVFQRIGERHMAIAGGPR